jgi:uncharacterized Fe-S cluster protein YjdI
MTDLERLVRSINIKMNNFCNKVRCCLGIDCLNGDGELFLNQKGNWTSPGGGSVSGTPTEIAFFDTTTSVTSDPLFSWDNTKKTLEINAGLRLNVEAKPYGVNFSLAADKYHYLLTTGTGLTKVDLSTITERGSVFVISDFDKISGIITNIITLDAGVGNLIQSTVGSAQTLVISTSGRSLTIQLVVNVGSYKWMVI